MSISVQALTIVVPALFWSMPCYGQPTHYDSKAWVNRLAAIEEKTPYRLRNIVGNGRPTLIAFIDHLCYTCLKSVDHLDHLKKQFSGRANIIVIDPSRITTAHAWAKNRYQVWFVPKYGKAHSSKLQPAEGAQVTTSLPGKDNYLAALKFLCTSG